MPFWPLGCPAWADSWIALGLRAPGASYLTVWHRGPLAEASGHPAEPSGHPAEASGHPAAPALASASAPAGAPAPASAPAATGDPAVATLPIPHLRGQPLTASILYPSGAGAGIRWDARTGVLSVSLPRTPSACVLSLVPRH